MSLRDLYSLRPERHRGLSRTICKGGGGGYVALTCSLIYLFLEEDTD